MNILIRLHKSALSQIELVCHTSMTHKLFPCTDCFAHLRCLFGVVRLWQVQVSSLLRRNISFPTRTIGNGPREGEQVPVDTPTNIHAILEFASGALVTLGASWDVWAHTHGNMELYGENGSLYGVPEPGSMLLLGAGLLGMAMVRRRREDV